MKTQNKELKVHNHLTFYPPDSDGDIEIDIWTAETGDVDFWVSFDVLKEWMNSLSKE